MIKLLQTERFLETTIYVVDGANAHVVVMKKLLKGKKLKSTRSIIIIKIFSVRGSIHIRRS